jgi:hypothetical protein
MTRLILDRVESQPLINSVDKFGETPLHLAFYKFCVDVIVLLLHKRAKLDVRNRNGKLAFDVMNTRDLNQQINFLEEVLERIGNDTSDANLKALNQKMSSLLMDAEAKSLRLKWQENQNKIAVNDKVLKEYRKRNRNKKELTQMKLLTIEDKLEYSVDNALKYEDGSDIDFDTISQEENDFLNDLKDFEEYSSKNTQLKTTLVRL